MQIIKELLDNSTGLAITSMAASFTSKPVSVGKNTLVSNQFGFAAGPAGTFFIDYCAVPIEDIDKGVAPIWSTFASVAIINTNVEAMFLDANIPVVTYRIRYVRTSGGGAFSYYANHKNLLNA
jgi:hypothetical protein